MCARSTDASTFQLKPSRRTVIFFFWFLFVILLAGWLPIIRDYSFVCWNEGMRMCRQNWARARVVWSAATAKEHRACMCCVQQANVEQEADTATMMTMSAYINTTTSDTETSTTTTAHSSIELIGFWFFFFLFLLWTPPLFALAAILSHAHKEQIYWWPLKLSHYILICMTLLLLTLDYLRAWCVEIVIKSIYSIVYGGCVSSSSTIDDHIKEREREKIMANTKLVTVIAIIMYECNHKIELSVKWSNRFSFVQFIR